MIEINGLYKSYKNDSNEKKIFTDFGLTVKQGEFLVVLGENGAGKSTLMKLITGEERCDSGDIKVKGISIKDIPSFKRRKFISKVDQNPKMGTVSGMTIYENLSMADNKGRIYGLSNGVNKSRKDYYHNLLKELNMGLEEKLYVKVGKLSGGQQQAVSLLMATIIEPEILLLDEHTSALDPKTSQVIMERTSMLQNKKGITTVMITHDMKIAAEYGDRIIFLRNGKVEEEINGEEKKRITSEEIFRRWEKCN